MNPKQERKPDKIVTATRPTRITFDGNVIDVSANKRGWPVLRIWLADRKSIHVRVAKSPESEDTFA